MPSELFNPASVSALLSAVVTAIAAACAWLLGRVPDWDDVRPLTWVALTASLAAACNFTATLEVPLPAYLWTGRVQVLMVALHVLAWHRYLPGWARRPMGRAHRRALWLLAAAGLVALWPGVVYGGAVVTRPLAWLGVRYHDPAVAPAAPLVWGVIVAYGIWGIALVARLGRGGAPFPLAHLACTGAILVMAVHDALVVWGLPLPTPYLVDFAFYGPITVLGLVTIRRVGQSATDLRHLNAGLARLVEERSVALERSQSALARAERLAALGQFAAGVAHEVNDPAQVVRTNLDHLGEVLRGDPREAIQESLRDARAGLGRIASLARQLLVAGQSAGRPELPLEPVAVGPAVAAAAGAARQRAGPEVAIEVRLPPGLHVLAEQEALVQVLTTLLASAVQSCPPGREGTVSVRAQLAGERVGLVVDDDGVGMSQEALEHVFEPFHTTKPSGMGTGLGLAVALGLTRAMRGRLEVESALGRGTRAHLELRRAVAPAPAVTPPGTTPPAPRRARLLVVDDDPRVRSSLARLLGRSHDVAVADGVWSGLERAQAGGFDLLLCDVMMPGGGGARFWTELALRAPRAMGRVVFMTGGAVTAEARAFLAGQPRRVLAKPFDAAAVEALLAELPPLPAPGPGPDATPPPGARPEAGRAAGPTRRG